MVVGGALGQDQKPEMMDLWAGVPHCPLPQGGGTEEKQSWEHQCSRHSGSTGGY